MRRQIYYRSYANTDLPYDIVAIKLQWDALLTGSRQHYLPQFLMKGFKSRISDGDSYVWGYMKDGKIFEPKIKNIGKEKGFYGLDGHGSVDDTITDYENDVAPKIDLLRQQSAICEINDPSIIDFVAHCSEN